MKKRTYISFLTLLTLFTLLNSCEEERAVISYETDYNSADSYNISNEDEEELFIDLSDQSYTPQDYITNWNTLTNYSYVRSKKIQEFNYTLKYLPIEYMISNELQKKNITQTEYDSLKTDYEGMEYYELKISIDDFKEETVKYQLSDMMQYQNRIKYLSFNMQSDLKAEIDNNEVVDCKLYHFERTFGLAPYTKVLMGFSKQDIGDSQTRTIVLEDNLFNKGLIKFNWQSERLKMVPKIAVL